MANENGGAAKRVPCDHQHPETWVCNMAGCMSKDKTYEHRPIDWRRNGLGPKNHRSSIRCMLREREGEQQAEANGKDEAQDEG